MGQGLLFTLLTHQVKNFTKHTKQNPRGAVAKGAVQTGRKQVWVAQGHAQWVLCTEIMPLFLFGGKPLIPSTASVFALWRLPAKQNPFLGKLPSRGSVSSNAKSLQEAFCIQGLGQCSNTGRFRRASPTKKSLYKSIDQLKRHPGLTSIPAQSYLLHSLTGWFPREISKVLAH